MNQCELLSDKLPMVRHCTAQWTADEAAHLAACPDCRLEWDLVMAGAALGDAATHGLDPDLMAQAVTRRLVADRRRRRWIRSGWGLGLAVAASLLLFVWPGREPMPEPGPVGVTATMELPMAELEGLEPEVLEEILAGLGDGESEAGTLEAPGFSDLAPTDLEQLLQTMEG